MTRTSLCRNPRQPPASTSRTLRTYLPARDRTIHTQDALSRLLVAACRRRDRSAGCSGGRQSAGRRDGSDLDQSARDRWRRSNCRRRFQRLACGLPVAGGFLSVAIQAESEGLERRYLLQLARQLDGAIGARRDQQFWSDSVLTSTAVSDGVVVLASTRGSPDSAAATAASRWNRASSRPPAIFLRLTQRADDKARPYVAFTLGRERPSGAPPGSP